MQNLRKAAVVLLFSSQKKPAGKGNLSSVTSDYWLNSFSLAKSWERLENPKGKQYDFFQRSYNVDGYSFTSN